MKTGQQKPCFETRRYQQINRDFNIHQRNKKQEYNWRMYFFDLATRVFGRSRKSIHDPVIHKSLGGIPSEDLMTHRKIRAKSIAPVVLSAVTALIIHADKRGIITGQERDE